MSTPSSSPAPSSISETKELPEFAPLTEAAIASCTDSGSFSCGRRYWRAGHMFDGVRRGATLRGQCYGSQPRPYRVEATLEVAGHTTTSNPVTVGRDCPLGGFCKHIVALLLTGIDSPASFEPRPTVATLVADKNRDELVALVELLIRHEPWLEHLLDPPVPDVGDVSDTPVDDRTIQRQIENVVRDHADHGRSHHAYAFGEFDPVARIQADVQPLFDPATAYEEAGRRGNALRMLVELTDGILVQYDTYSDDGGDLSTLLIECDRRLSAMLINQASLPTNERLERNERLDLITAQFAIWHEGVASSGHDLSQEGLQAIVLQATAEEVQLVSDWLQGLLNAPPLDLNGRRWIVGSAVTLRSRFC